MIDGHAWGMIFCDRDGEEPCRILLCSSGRGAESVARDASKTIDRCSHLAVQAHGQMLQRAGLLLDGAERNLHAAELCLLAADKKAEVEELLDEAETAAGEAAKLLDQAVHLDKVADALIVEVFADLPQDSLLGCPPTPQEIEVLVIGAGGQTDKAEELIEDLPQSQSVDLLRSRIEQIRTRGEGLFGRMRASGNAAISDPA
ncbi:hypothetical protein [Streptomyces sp. NPDC057287]|uniref:hypothetical protein n=1 Tax=Streptomyces sp. NPDC057287 TaxID=3346086 RepID=UPI0036352D36